VPGVRPGRVIGSSGRLAQARLDRITARAARSYPDGVHRPPRLSSPPARRDRVAHVPHLLLREGALVLGDRQMMPKRIGRSLAGDHGLTPGSRRAALRVPLITRVGMVAAQDPQWSIPAASWNVVPLRPPRRCPLAAASTRERLADPVEPAGLPRSTAASSPPPLHASMILA